MTDPDATAIEQQTLTASLTDLDSLVAEVGSSYPLVAYPADAEPSDERGAMDAMILAGLVKP
jgi:hypothetical protein